MGQKKQLEGSMDNLFGKRGATTKKSEAVAEVKAVGREKVIPDHFKKTNYIIDPEVIKKFKVIATLKGVSVNMLANEVLGEYVEKNFKI